MPKCGWWCASYIHTWTTFTPNDLRGKISLRSCCCLICMMVYIVFNAQLEQKLWFIINSTWYILQPFMKILSLEVHLGFPADIQWKHEKYKFLVWYFNLTAVFMNVHLLLSVKHRNCTKYMNTLTPVWRKKTTHKAALLVFFLFYSDSATLNRSPKVTETKEKKGKQLN